MERSLLSQKRNISLLAVIALTSLAGLSPSSAYSAAATPAPSTDSSSFYLKLATGLGFTFASDVQSVDMTPLLTNNYADNDSSVFTIIEGGGAGYSKWFNDKYQWNVGLSFYYQSYNKTKGTERPFFNASANFDTLNYSYSAESSALFVESSFTKKTNYLNPYLLVGLGQSWNTLFGYNEVPTNPAGSAAPALAFFRHKTITNFAWEAGIGFTKQVNSYSSISLGYQYVSVGEAKFGTSVLQTVASHLKDKHMATHNLILTLLFNM